MSNIVKFLRKKYQTGSKNHGGVIGAVMALCMSLNPWAVPYAEAGTIVRTGQTTNLMQNNKAEIYAGSVAIDSSTAVGLNTFKQFDVNAGEIANMHFRKEGSNNYVNTLINVVNSQINIHGTINAIKNSRIDGNLVFLSKDGMVVGNTGVINAGSLTVMTPNYSYDNNIDITTSTDIDENSPARRFYLDKYTAMQAGTYALNKDASIVVKGTINTAGGIHLKAPNVVIGGTYTDASGVEQQANAKLRTGVDFASLVNTSDVITNLQGSAVNSRLEAKSDGSYQLLMSKVSYTDAEGNTKQKIVLKDHANNSVDGDASINIEAYNQYFNMKDTNLGLLYTALGSTASGNNTIQAGVKVVQGSTIEALGDIDISATATNKNTEGFLGYDVTEWNFATLATFGVYKVKADVDIDGTVTAGAFQTRPADTMLNDVGKLSVTAKSEGSYSSEDWKGTKAIANAKNLLMSRDAFSQTVAGEGKIETFADALGAFEFGLGMVDSAANVTIGNHAHLTATANSGFKTETTGTGVDAKTKIVANKDTGIYSGGAMCINAVNSTSLNIAKKVQNKAYDPNRVQETEVSDVVNFIASYGEAVGNAKVTINGSLESNGSIQVGAVSTVKDSVKGSIAKPPITSDKPNFKAGSAYVNFSANFVNLTNKSDVIMGTDSSIVANKNKTTKAAYALGDGVQLTSMTREEIAVKSAIKSDSNAVANIGIGVNIMDTNANMNIDGTITAGSIDIKAADSLEVNDLEVSNEDVVMEDSWFDPIKDWTKENIMQKDGFQWATNTVNRLIGGLKDKKVQSNYENGVSDKISGGALFGIEYATNKANLTLGANAKLISTGGDVTLKSIQKTADSGFVVDNEITNATGKEAGIMAGAAVGVQSMDNQANLVIVGRDLPTAVDSTLANTITSAGAINVDASSVYEYGRAKSTINNLVFVQVYDAIKAEFGENSNVAKDAKALIDFLNGGLNHSGTLQEQYERMIALEQAKQRLLENKTYNKLKGLQGKVGDFLENIKSLFKANSYLQFYVANATSIAADSHGNYGIANSFGFTGSLGVQSIDNKANILIGKNAKLIATDEVKVNSTVDRTTTAAVGKVGNEVFFMLPNLKSNNGNKNGVGVTVGVNNNDANSSIIIAEGAKLKGSSVELNSKNNLLDVAFVYGGIESTEAGGAGIINVMAGDDNTLALLDDEAVLEATGATSITSTSNINRWNITGETGESGTKTAGAALNIIDYTSNSIAGVTDNDYKTITDNDTTNKTNGVRDIDKTIKAVLGDNYSTNNIGSSSKTLKGSINAGSLNINSKTDGIVENLSVASGASGTTHDAVGGAAGAGGAGAAAAVNSMQDQINAKGADNTGWQIAGAGSASLNFAKGDTAAYLENTKVTMAHSTSDGSLKLAAEDSSTWGAYSGAAAISKAGAGSQFSHSAALAGAVAANKSTRNTLAQIKDVNVLDALNVVNSAQNKSSEVAIGLSLAADTGTKTDASGFDASVSASINFLDDTTKANILNSNIIGATDTDRSSLTSVINYAFDNAVQVAGGVSVDYAKTNVNAGVSVAVEYVENTVEAKIKDSQLGVIQASDTTNAGHELKLLQNYAATNLTQLAGAVSVGLANGEHTLGSGAGAVVYDSFNNTVKAIVDNTKATAKSVDVQALDAKITFNETSGTLTQLAPTDAGILDNIALAKLAKAHNYIVTATINGQKTEITLVKDENGNLVTKELASGETLNDLQYKALDKNNQVVYVQAYEIEKKESAFVDTKGEEAQALANGGSTTDNKVITGVVETELSKSADEINQTVVGNSEAIYTSEKAALDNKGSLILNTAISFSKVNQEGSKANLAPALLFDSATNTYEAAVSGSTITLSSATATADTVTGNFNLKANSDVTVFSVAAGAAVNNNNSKGVAVAGSRVAQEISNTTKAVLSDSKVTADKVDVEAKADDALISVAGNFDYSKDVGAGVGGAWAKNKLTNTTGAYIYGSELTAANAAKGLDLSVQGTNHTKIWAIAGGGSINDADASLVTVQGAYAHNEGVNNTYAIVDASEKVKEETDNTKYKRSKITNVNAITVATDDNSKEVAVAGAVTGSSNSKAMLGGALATNTTEADAEKTGSEVAKQNNKAALNNTDITVLKKTDPVRISVHAKDDSTKFAMAIGASKVANDANIFGVEGDRAINNLNKAIRAEMLNTNIDKTSEATSNSSKVELKAENDALMVTTADTFAFNGGNVDLGIGSAANDSHIDTEAVLDGGTIQAQSLKVHADSLNRITNVGIGVVAGSVNNTAFTLTGVGNYASNNLINNTKAQIKNVTITTNGTTAVLADSTDRIRNYIGSLGAKYNKGSGANIGLGASIGINTIGGDTEASVSSSTITALGNDDGVKTDNHSVDADENGKNKGTITTIAKDAAANNAKTGLVIDAQAKHNIYDVGINVGVMLSSKAGGGTGVPIAAGGAVMLNDITGNTKALLEKTDVNNNLNANSAKADVTVKAFDEIDSYNWAINIEGAVGGTVGVAAGAATTKDDYNRNTSALIQGDATVLDDGIAKKNWVKANKLAVEALSHTDLYEVGVGSNISATGGDSATVSVSAGAVVMIDKQSNKTIAGITNINSLNEGLKVASDRVANLSHKAAQANIAAAIAEYGVGVTAGIGAVYVDDDTLTEAGIVDSTLSHWGDSTSEATYNDSVTADNNTKITVSQWDVGLDIAPIGGNLGILINKNNINSFTGVTVSGSTIGNETKKASMLTTAAMTKLNTSFTNVNIGVGTVFGVGVTYGDAQINTSNLVNISGSTLYGHDITNAAKEIINVDQTMADVTVGIVGWGNSYVNTTIGTDVKKEYTAQNNKYIKWITDEAKQKLETEINKNTSESNDSTIGKLKNAKIATSLNEDGTIQGESLAEDPNLKAAPIALFETKAGSTKKSMDGTEYTTAKGDVVALTNSHLFADNAVTAKAEMTHNVDQRTGTGTVSAIGGYSKSNLEVSDNVGVKIVDTDLKANRLGIETNVGGELYSLAVEAGVNGVGQFGISYANHKGGSFVNVSNGSKLEAANALSVAVNDTTSTTSKVVGAGVNVLLGSNLMGEATDESNATIAIDGSTLAITTIETDNNINAMNISTNKQNSVKSSMLFAGVNGIQAMDNYAKARVGKEGVNGAADTSANQSDINIGTGNTFVAGKVNLTTNNAPKVEAWADYDGVKIFGFNGPEPTAEAYGTSRVTISNSNSFITNDLDIDAKVVRQKSGSTVYDTVKATSLNVTALNVLTAESPEAHANVGFENGIVVGANSYKGWAKEYKVHYKAVEPQVIDQEKGIVKYIEVTKEAWLNKKEAEALLGHALTAADYTATRWYEGEAAATAANRLTTMQSKAKTGVTDIDLQAQVDTSSYATMKGVEALSVLTFGSSQAYTRSRNNSVISFATAANAATKLNSLQATINNNEASYTKAGVYGLSLVSVMPYAAYAENDAVNSSIINLTGKLELADNLTIQSNTNDDANLAAESTDVGLVDIAGGVEAKNTITNTSNINIDKAEITTGGAISVLATSKVNFNQKQNYMIDASAYNFGGGEGSLGTNTITQNANVNMGKTGAAKLTSGDAIQIGANTVQNIKAQVKQTVFGLLHGTANLDLKDNFTFNAAINVGNGSVLQTTKDAGMTLAAWDEGVIDEFSYANAKGVSTTVTSALGSKDNKNKLIRNAAVNVAGTAQLTSKNDIKLLAGKTLDDDYARFKLNSLAEADSDGVIAWYVNPENNTQIIRNNKINIATGAVVSSNRNVDLYANNGAENLNVQQLRRTWYNGNPKEDGDSFTYSSVNGEIKKVASDTNEVKVDGTVIAGKAYKQVIIIGTDNNGHDAVQVVALDSATYAAIQATNKAGLGANENKFYIFVDSEGTDLKGTDAKSTTTSDGFTQQADGSWTNGTFTLSNVDYANNLYQRYLVLCNLVQNYSAALTEQQDGSITSTSQAYIGYYTELQRVKNLMQTLGTVVVDSTTGNITDFKANLKVPTITLPDLAAYGGSININTHYLHGAGTLEANGNPEIKVLNNTNLALQVNNITLGNTKGGVNYNGTTLSGTEADKKAKIAEINKTFNKNNSETVAHIAGASGDGSITIDSRFMGNISVNNGTEIVPYKPMADITINGYVNANEGNVNIHNKSHDIIIEGKKATSSAGVNGSVISIVAEGGSINQGFTDRIENIGGSVQEQYSEIYADYKNALKDSQTTGVYNNLSTKTAAAPDGNRISGKEIYLNATDININGTIQSGFANYTVTIPDTVEVKNKIATIESAWRADGSKNLTDAEVMSSGNAYLIVLGGAQVTADGSYEEKLDAYYNPATKQIVIPDVDASGGKIYLTGRIVSTGNGKIFCMDGTYDINVTNETNHELKLGDLKINDVEGLVKITDTSTQKVTEITRSSVKNYDFFIKDTTTGQTKVNVAGQGAVVNNYDSAFTNGNVKYENNALSYNPTTGLRYNWTTGEENGTTTYYTRTSNSWIWGATGEHNVTTEDRNDPNKQHKEITYGNQDKPNGEFIGTLNGATGDFVVSYEYNVLNEKESAATLETYYTGFLWMNKHYVKSWTKDTKTSQVYEASVAADKAVGIKFIGNKDKNSFVNVNSVGSVELSGNIGNSKAYTTTTTDANNAAKVASAEEKGTFQITSSGNVYQTGGRIYGKDIVIKANGDIDIDNIVAGDNLNLTATTNITSVAKADTLGQSINVNVNNRMIDDYTTKANVALGEVGSIYTDYTNVKAVGNLSMQTTGLVRGEYISLTSSNGGADIRVDTGSNTNQRGNLLFNGVSVSAKNDINLTHVQPDGSTIRDLYIGKVYSSEGDVTITTPGTLIDALPYGDSTMNGETDDEVLQRYRDIGLLNDANKDNSASIKAKSSEYRQKITEEFSNYQELKGKYTTEAFNQSLYDQYATNCDTYQQKLNQYGYDESKWTTEQKQEMGALKQSINTATDSLTQDGIVYGQLREKFVTTSSEFSSVDDYLSQDAAYQKLLKNGGVTANALLYALEDSIINNTTVSTSSKAANVIGKNITINTGLGTGLLDGNTETIGFANIAAGNEAGLAALKKLANADASMVEFNAAYKDVDIKNAAGNVIGTRKVLDSSNTTATIIRKLPIGLQTLDETGKINIGLSGANASGNAFVEGRLDNSKEEAGQNITMNIQSVNAGTQGDVYIKSLGAITNANTTAGVLNSDSAVVKGNNVTLLAKENIGTNQAVLTMDMTGKLIAVAESLTKGNVYLDQVNSQNLNIQSIAAGKDIFVQANKNILMADIPATTVQGYIQSTKGAINLVSIDGSIGKDESNNEKALRIKNSETLPQGEQEAVNVVTSKSLAAADKAAGQMEIMQKGVVSLIAKGSVIAEGVSSIYPEGVEADKPAGTPAGTMNVRVHGYGDNTLDNIKLHANGYLRVLEASALEEGTIRSKDIEANNTINLSSAYDLDMLANVKTLNTTNGNVVLSSDKNVNLKAGTITAITANITAGDKIVQTGSAYNKDNLTYTGNKLEVETLVAEAVNGLDLHGWANKLENVSLYNANGDISLGNGGDKTLNLLAVSDSKTDATAKLQGNVTIHNYDDKSNDATTDNIINITSSITAIGNVTIINDEKDKVVSEAEKLASISTKHGTTISGNKVELTTSGSISNIADIYATNESEGFIKMSADDDLINYGKLQANGTDANDNSITISARNDIFNVGDAGDFIKADKNVALSAGNIIYNDTRIESTNGDIKMDAGKAIFNLKATDADGHLNTETGSTGSIVATNGNVVMTTTIAKPQDAADGFYGIRNTANIQAGKNVLFAKTETVAGKPTLSDAVAGKIENSGDIDSGDNTYLYSVDSLVNSGNITAENNVVLDSANNIVNSNSDTDLEGAPQGIWAKNGFVDIDATNNLYNNAGFIRADGEITLNSWKGNAVNEANIISDNGQVNIIAAYVYSLDPEKLDASDKDVVGNVINSGTIEAKDRVQLGSLHGNVENSATITSTAGMVRLSANDYDLANSHTNVGGVRNYTDSTSTPNINASLDIIITAENLLINNGNLTVENNGDILVYAGQNAEGAIIGDCDIINTGNFTNKSQDGNIYMYASCDVFNQGVMEAQYGDIVLTSQQGNIYNYTSADLYAGGGNVILTALQQNPETYYINASGEKINIDRGDAAHFRETETRTIQYQGADGQWYNVIANGVIYNAGDAMALGTDGEGGKISLVSEHGSVYNYDDFATLDNTADNNYYKPGVGAVDSSAGGIMVSTDNVVLSAKEGFLYNEKNIVAGENVALTAKYGLSNFAYDIEANGNIDLVATDGNLYNNTMLVSQTGDINLTAENGTVVNMLGGDIFALGGDVSMTSGASKVDSNGQLKPNANTIYTVDSGYSYIDSDGVKHHSSSTGQTKTLEELLPDGTTIAWPGDINDRIVTVDKYYKVGGTGEAKLIDQTVNVNGLTTAEKESIYSMINVIDDKGKPVPLKDTNGNALKVDGNVDVFRIGDTINRGDVVALGSTTVDTAGNVVAEKPGTVHIRSEHGNVVNYDNFAMVDGVDQYEYARNHKKYILASSGIGLEAPEGYFYNSLGYFTDGDLILEAKKDMTIGDNFSIGEVGGDIIVTSTQGKVANVSTNPLVAGESIVLSGKTGVSSEGVMIAGSALALGSQSGNIEAKEVQGKVVVLYDADSTINSTIKVDTIKASDYLALEANNVAISKIVNTGKGDLVMDITGPNGSTMAGNLQLTTEGNTVVSSLNVHNAKLTVENGRLGIDKLHVTGTGHFDAYSYLTAVYGDKPAWDDSKSIYYDLGNGNAKAFKLPFDFDALFFGDGNKKDALTTFIEELPKYKANRTNNSQANDGWMNLYIDDANNQRSNGLLLHVDKRHYVHSQRYAADTLSKIISDAKASDAYTQAIEPIVPQYFRFDLINEGLVAEVAEKDHFFTITNANHILGKGDLNPEDMLGLEKAILGPDKAKEISAREEEERKQKSKKKKD